MGDLKGIIDRLIIIASLRNRFVESNALLRATD